MKRLVLRNLLPFAATWLIAQPLLAQQVPPPVICSEDGACKQSLTREQMFRHLDRLLGEARFDEMQPFLAAMRNDPQAKAQLAYLEGRIAYRQGNWPDANRHFRTALQTQPKFTQARLELARTLYNQGSVSAADYHFRLADSGDLPPDIARVVRNYRQSIRRQKNWDVSLQLGLAPDSNINSATSERTVTFEGILPGVAFELDDDARSRTGVGQSLASTGRVRLKLGAVYAVDVEASARLVNYSGSRSDDVSIAPAVGISRDFGNRTRLGVAALFSERWYGGKHAQESVGARLRLQQLIGSNGQLQADLSYRQISNRLNDGQSGPQYGFSLSFDRALGRTSFATLSAFALREPLTNPVFASTTTGISAGIGSELPWGLNGGLSLSLSRSWYDGYWVAFDATRRDFTLQSRAYLGLRSLRWMGFSPSIEYLYSHSGSNIPIYDFDRHRLEFQVARYF
jgi:outer membrane protein